MGWRGGAGRHLSPHAFLPMPRPLGDPNAPANVNPNPAAAGPGSAAVGGGHARGFLEFENFHVVGPNFDISYPENNIWVSGSAKTIISGHKVYNFRNRS